MAELILALAAVSAAGGWDSPFVLTVLPPMLLAGLRRGYRLSLLAAGFACVWLGVTTLVVTSAVGSVQAASQVLLLCVLTAAVGGYAHGLFIEAEERQEVFAGRMARLAETNALLAQLTHVARTLPSSLDLGDTLAAAMGHLGELFDSSGAAIFLLDPATGTWRAEASCGLPAPTALRMEELPSPARTAIARSVTMCEPALDPEGGRPGLWPVSRSALYSPLLARQRIVALVVLEHRELHRFGDRDAQIMGGLTEPLALAIDNALWFERLRTLGAEGERERLARSLHDRIGQGLAYVRLELDRLSHRPDPGPDLARLRDDVGDLLAEVRETLRQLRTRVTETSGLVALAEVNLPRFTERTGILGTVDDQSAGRRLPLLVEQELWRVLQEALSNVERHSHASHVDVTWTVSGSQGRLEISDDGCGFDPAKIDGLTASGIMAMRERANAIGARLAFESEDGNGTRLMVEVEAEG